MWAIKFRIMVEGTCATLLSAGFFLLVMYPNLPLAIEQIDRMSVGFDGLANSTSPLLNRFVDDINASGFSPEWYILENIDYASDFDVWWNLDYWETPEEVILQGRTDCEGKAILTKAVYNILDARKKALEPETVEEIRTEIKSQQHHTFVEVSEQKNVSGQVVNDTREVYKMEDEPVLEEGDGPPIDIYSVPAGFMQFIRQVPPVRLFILSVGLLGIWGRYFRRIHMYCKLVYELGDMKKVKKAQG